MICCLSTFINLLARLSLISMEMFLSAASVLITFKISSVRCVKLMVCGVSLIGLLKFNKSVNIDSSRFTCMRAMVAISK